MDKTILILAEYNHCFSQRFAPLVAEIRSRRPGIRIVALLACFAFQNTDSQAEILLDEAHFAVSINDAISRIATLRFDEVIAFFQHNLTIGDSKIYSITQRIPGVRTSLIFRNRVSLVKFFETGADDRELIALRSSGARATHASILLKVWLLTALGAPLFCLGRLVNVLLPRRQGKERILFIKLDVLGDMIVALPYLRALRRARPRAELTVLASNRGAVILKEQHTLEPDGLYDDLLIWDAPWHFKDQKSQGCSDFLQILRRLPQLWRKRYDLVLQPVAFGTGIFFALSICGARLFAIIDPLLPLARALRPFVSDPVDPDPARVHHLEEHVALVVRRLGVANASPLPKLRVSETALAGVRSFLERNGHRSGQRLVLFNVGAGNPVRVWDRHKFAAIVGRTQQQFGATVVLTGTKGESEFASDIAALSGTHPLNSAGELSLNEIIALTSLADLLVTVDTGIMHLAAALETPLVAIFGAGLVEFARPLSANHLIVKEEQGCSGCADRCFVSGPPPCLEQVSADAVFQAVEQMLNRQNPQ